MLCYLSCLLLLLKNRMDEALRLFNSILNNKWFLDTSVILFLNKKDLFQEKIMERPLADCFPDFRGELQPPHSLSLSLSLSFITLPFYRSSSHSGRNTYTDGVNFIRQKFVSLNRVPNRKTVYTHVTCATDTSNIQYVFQSCTEIIISEHLRDANLF